MLSVPCYASLFSTRGVSFLFYLSRCLDVGHVLNFIKKRCQSGYVLTKPFHLVEQQLSIEATILADFASLGFIFSSHRSFVWSPD
jgi:hypothetical protein